MAASFLENIQRSDIVQQLRQEILLRQGFKPPTAATIDMGLGLMAAAFPMGVFPTGAMHELVSDGAEGRVATEGFIAGLIGKVMTKGGTCVWIGPRRIFPPGLTAFGVDPDRVLFVDLRREKDVLWALEEALKCEGLAAVVGEVRDVSWIASRRFQLAVEQSRVTGFVMRERSKSRQPIAAVARWRVTPVAGGRLIAEDRTLHGMPGVGFPRWKVELLRIRSGQPGQWEIEWRDGSFHFIRENVGLDLGVVGSDARNWQRKTG